RHRVIHSDPQTLIPCGFQPRSKIPGRSVSGGKTCGQVWTRPPSCGHSCGHEGRIRFSVHNYGSLCRFDFGRGGRGRFERVQPVHSCTFRRHSDVRVVFEHRLTHVSSNGHQRLVGHSGLREFGDGVVPEIMETESFQPGITRECSPTRTPRDHGFFRVV